MNIYQPTHKHCHKCNTTKPRTEFYKNSKTSSGLKSQCKHCDDLYQQQYSKQQLLKIKLKKQLELENKTSKICKVCNIDKPFSAFNKSNEIKDGYKTICIECNNAAIAKRKQKRREQTIANIPHRKEKNKNYMRVYTNEKRKTDPFFKLKGDIRKIIGQCLRENGYTKRSKTYTILGCTFNEFLNHIENQFVEGMSWENRNEWHIDHIVPIAFGNTEEEIILINHYTNLRPLWAVDNITKGDKLTEDVINHPIYKSIIEIRSTQNFNSK